MATSAQIGMGARLGFHATAPSSATAVAEIVSINPSFPVGEAEATSLDSGGIEEWIPALKAGTLQATLNYLPGTHTDLLALRTARTTGNWVIEYPATDTTTAREVLDFSGFITDLGHTIERADVMQGTLSLRLTTDPVTANRAAMDP